MHEFHRIVGVTVLPPYSLRVEFEDGTVREVDLECVLHGEVFGPLRDPEMFAKVRIDPEVHTVVWPNDADFHPDTLYDWESVKQEAARRAREWAAARA
jgi:hypothetical protein